jgi:hypothetical protein
MRSLFAERECMAFCYWTEEDEFNAEILREYQLLSLFHSHGLYFLVTVFISKLRSLFFPDNT